MDPYACAVSDVYQDLFGEGSYCGKGIYDVDLFEAALAGRIPDNTVLSHDLLEGIFARAGPGVRHRGDRRVPDPLRCRRGAPVSLGTRRLAVAALDFRLGGNLGSPIGAAAVIPLVGRWKMIDNLRRSLSAPAAFACPRRQAGPCRSQLRRAGARSSWRQSPYPLLIPFLTVILPRRLRACQAHASPRRRRGPQARAVASCASRRFPAASGLGHVRRDCADAVPAAGVATQSARMGHAAQAKVSPRLDLSGFYRQMAGASASPSLRRASLRGQRRVPGRSPRRSVFCGCCRRPSRAGSACRR